MQHGKYRQTEELFGWQALGTGLMSLLQWWGCAYNDCEVPMLGHLGECGNEYTAWSFWLLWVTMLMGFPQVIAARVNHLWMRHVSNGLTSVTTFALSMSLALGQGNNIAIAGYFFLSYASFRCYFYTASLTRRYND